MTAAGWILDGALAAALLFLSVRMLYARDLLQAVVLFIAFGLLMAMAWARLAAPDISLAEAGIGAGLTGVLLIDALHNLRWSAVVDDEGEEEPTRRSRGGGGFRMRLIAGMGAAGAFVLLVAVVLGLPDDPGGLTAAVSEALPASGVEHPVTAVLLDFRSLDTLLELGVLLVALMGVLSLRRDAGLARIPLPATGDAVMGWLLRVLLPVMALAAGYLLWRGSFSPGGAFQAGVILAAMGVFLWLSGRHSIERLSPILWQPLLALGLLCFVGTAGYLLAEGREMLEYPSDAAGMVILALETAAAVSIGVGLTALFVALHPPDGGPAPIEDHP